MLFGMVSDFLLPGILVGIGSAVRVRGLMRSSPGTTKPLWAVDPLGALTDLGANKDN